MPDTKLDEAIALANRVISDGDDGSYEWMVATSSLARALLDATAPGARYRAGMELRWEDQTGECLLSIFPVGEANQWASGKWWAFLLTSGKRCPIDAFDTRDDARAAVEAAVRERLGMGDHVERAGHRQLQGYKPMSETMIERVGKAIDEAWDNDPDLPPIVFTYKELAALACAAIKAMREPTFDPDDVHYGIKMSRLDWWQAMIDRALKRPTAR